MKFDPSKPHGLVYGISGAAFEQNGHLFTPTGELFEEDRQTDLALEPRAARGQQGNGQQGRRQ